MFWRHTLWVVLVYAWLALVPAHAESLQPLPELAPQFDLAKYAAATDTATKDFANLPDVSFAISLPKTWVERMSIGEDFGEIARFDGPAFGDVRPYFSFKRLAVNRENTARLELVNYVLKNGFVLRSLKEIDARNVEALYVVVDEHGDSFVVRAMMRLMGPTMLLAEYAVPVQAWEAQRDAQTFAIKSFKFRKDSDAPIEKRIERVYFDALRFYYPASWIFEGEDVPADNAVNLRLVSKNEAAQESGRIRLSVMGVQSLKNPADRRTYGVDVAGFLKAMRKSYEDRGFDLGTAVENKKPDLNLPADFAVMDIYNVRKKTSQYENADKPPVTHELWLAVFRGKGDNKKTYVAELLTPSRNQDIYQWSVNTRAFEIILKSVQ